MDAEDLPTMPRGKPHAIDGLRRKVTLGRARVLCSAVLSQRPAWNMSNLDVHADVY